MAQFEFKLPDIGEGVVEGEIVKWLVKPGDEIAEDQPLVEVMTDKATVTIPSPRRGKVIRTVGNEGEIAKVHQTLVVLEVAESGKAAAEAVISIPPATAQAAPSLPPQHAGQPAPLQAVHAPQPQPGSNGDQRRVLATPVTRRMAREMGVDLASLHGSGPQGRVMKADVLAHAEFRAHAPLVKAPSPVPAPAQRPETLAHDEVRPIRGLRKSIARSMVQSHTYVVPFTFVEECDTKRLSAMRDRINADLAKRGEAKLSYLPFISRALVRGFDRYPELNAVMDEEKQSLVVKKDVNLGFGAATEQGLTVFVVKDVRHQSIRAIGAEIDRLAKAAREQKLQLHELQGSTFTITSLGRDGGLLATPVVKHPEVGILGVHRIQQIPVVENGQVVIGERMNLSCSFDHRVIDGHIGAAFLYEVIRALEAPEAMLVD
ncbi:MAG TPA: dihydrolipoamide acetyltransferase family protein [Myxococcales bacterium]|nr:dihydrolipoamide acetyltransferase family protein [Myxococcales bacterium]